MERLIMDVVHDFGTKPRLISHRGNAMLVASSIYEVTKYYDLFQKTSFKGKCAVITSYNPNAQDVTKEETGAGTETEKQFLYSTYKELLEPTHNARFVALMDQHMPKWHSHQDTLNRLPVRHEQWSY